jgi:nitroreductase
MKSRMSVRSYDKKRSNKAAFKKLREYASEISKQAKTDVHFLCTDKKSETDDQPEKLGTYGIIKGAEFYIIGVADKKNIDAVEFGYLFEKVVLFATALGLGTCWIGGTLKRSDFEKQADLKENEIIPIVSPVGIKKEKTRFLDKAMRAGAGSNKRKPWNELFFEGTVETPLTEDAAGAYKTVLEMVRIGPSASNKQPWRVIRVNNEYRLFLCRNEGYGVANYDLQKNDMGIAKCHFELAANELGLEGSWAEEQLEKTAEKWEHIATWVAIN